MKKKFILIVMVLLCHYKNHIFGQPFYYKNIGLTVVTNFDSMTNKNDYSLLRGRSIYFLADTPFLFKNVNGWFFYQIGGSSNQANFGVTTGSTTSSGVYNTGISKSINRSLGSLATSSGIYEFGYLLQNKSELALNKINIKFKAKQWRKGGSTQVNKWKFYYSISSDSNLQNQILKNDSAGDFYSIQNTLGSATLNGDLPINQLFVIDSIINIYWDTNQYLFLLWQDEDNIGSDDLMSIDDVEFSAEQILSEPLITIKDTPTISTHQIQVNFDVKYIVPPNNISFRFSNSIANIINLPFTSIDSIVKFYAFSFNNLNSADSFYIQWQTTYPNINYTSSYFGFKTKNFLDSFYIRSPYWLDLLQNNIFTTSTDTIDILVKLKKPQPNISLSDFIFQGDTTIIIRSVRIINYDSFYIIKVINQGTDGLLKIKWQPSVSTINSGILNNMDSINIQLHKTYWKNNRLPLSKIYHYGDTIRYGIEFSQPIFLKLRTTNPTIRFNLNGTTKYFLYEKGSGTKILWFYYEVIQNDLDTSNNINIHSYTTNSSTLTDMWNTTLSSSSIIFAPIKNIVVNALTPLITIKDTPTISTHQIQVNFDVKYIVPPNNISFRFSNSIANIINLPFTSIDSIVKFYAFSFNNLNSADSFYIQWQTTYPNINYTSSYFGFKTKNFLDSFYIRSPYWLDLLQNNIFTTSTDTIDILVKLKKPQPNISLSDFIFQGDTTIIIRSVRIINYDSFYIIKVMNQGTDGLLKIKWQPSVSTINSGILNNMDSINIQLHKTYWKNNRLPLSKIYHYGDTIRYGIEFSQPIFLKLRTTNPTIRFNLNGTTKYFLYEKGSGTKILWFYYEVIQNDLDTSNNINIHSYTTNSSTLTDMWNTTLSSSSIIFAPIKNIVVNALTPLITIKDTPTISTHQIQVNFDIKYIVPPNNISFRFSNSIANIINLPFTSIDSIVKFYAFSFNNLNSADSFYIQWQTTYPNINYTSSYFGFKTKNFLDSFYIRSPYWLDLLQNNIFTTSTDTIDILVKLKKPQPNISLSDFIFQGDTTIIIRSVRIINYDSFYIIKVMNQGTDGLLKIKWQPSVSTINSGILNNMDSINIQLHKTYWKNNRLPLSKIYHYGDTIRYGIEFSQPIFLKLRTTNPTIRFNLNGTTKYFLYEKGSGTKILWFYYEVIQNDLDTSNNINIHSYTTNSSTLTDMWNTTLSSSSIIFYPIKNIVVNALTPLITIKDTPTISTHQIQVNFDIKYIVPPNNISFRFSNSIANIINLPFTSIDSIVKFYAFSFNNLNSADSFYIQWQTTYPNINYTSSYFGFKTKNFLVSFYIRSPYWLDSLQNNIFTTSTDTIDILVKLKKPQPNISLSDFIFQGDTTIIIRSVRIINYDSFYIIKVINQGTDGLLKIKWQPSVSTINSGILNNMDSINIQLHKTYWKNNRLPLSKIYHYGDTIRYGIEFSQPIFLKLRTTNPTIRFNLNGTTKYFLYEKGSGTKILWFYYEVIQNDLDTSNNINIHSYTTNSSTLTDMWNTTLSSSSIIFAPIKNIVVNAIFPIVKSIDVKSFNYLKANDSLILELIFNKKISSNKDTSNIWFTLKFDNNDSIILKSVLIGFQDKIQFFTQIPYRITALNGVIFGRILNSQTALYDSLGNPYNHSLINVNISKNIFVDGLAPYFLDSISTITICQTMRNLSLQKYLSINNVNKNQAHSIKLVQFPKYGTITGLNTIYYSTSNILNINANYQNLNQSNSGWDTVVFSVSDGYYISYKKILIRLLDSIVNNIIQSKQNLCVYDSNYIYGNTINIPQRNISYKWQVATSDTSDFYTLSGNQSSLLIGTYSNESQRWFRRLVSDSICSSVSNIVSVNFFNISLWTGKKDSLWQNSYNWCNNKVPTKSSTVFIPQEASFYPVIYKNAEVGVLKLENRASLINNGYLKITNEIIAENNSLDFTKGSLEFNGKGFQQLNSLKFKEQTINNLFINNSSLFYLNNKLVVKEKMGVWNGKFITNDSLYILPQTEIISDDIRWQGAVHIKGPIFINPPQFLYNSFDNNISLLVKNNLITDYLQQPLPNIFYSTNSLLKSYQNQDAWVANNGLVISVKNIDSSFAQQLPIQLSGNLYLKDKEYEIPFNKNSFYFIGNPYWSKIDLQKMFFEYNIAPYYWVWERSWGISGAFRCLPAEATYIINPLQGFWVYALNNYNNRVIINKAARLSFDKNINNINYRQNFQGIGLQLKKGDLIFDEFYFILNPLALDNFDRYDALKLFNTDINIFSKSLSGENLNIDARYFNTRHIPIYFNADTMKNFDLLISQKNLPEGFEYRLLDHLTQQQHNLVEGQTISITYDEKFPRNLPRFELISIKDSSNQNNLILTITPNIVQNELKYSYQDFSKVITNKSIQLINSLGVVVWQKSLGLQSSGTDIVNITSLQSGTYFIVLRNSSSFILEKIIKL